MLSINRYRFRLLARDTIRFASFPGSALRGLFGHSLKDTVCVTRLEHCENCMLRHDCVYSYLFETQATLDNGQDAPHPLIFDVRHAAQETAPHESLFVEATLVGEAGKHLPYLIEAWRRAGKRGLGRQRAKFDLVSVDVYDFTTHVWLPVSIDGTSTNVAQKPFDISSDTQVNMTESVVIELLTPYRSKRNGRLVTPESFTASAFVISLLRRIDRLRQLHERERSPINRELFIVASKLTMPDAELIWTDWVRYSSRQHTHMNLGGVIGSFAIDGAGLPLVWTALQLGQWIQAGKNTLFGLGCYRLKSRTTSA
ncbi:MAG: CRISPR-associated endoribonuclease Cas6 [Nitrospirales bacterium]|nr:MAG: CRISPR-associated endoribonuclease Cas6 [Nitrospirales bacterium]